MQANGELVAVLRQARALLARPGNDFAWSSWHDAQSALAALDKHIAAIEAGQLPPKGDVTLLFAPTGPIQEVSLSSGWAEEFLAMASRLDTAVARVYTESDRPRD
jgi:hypothetical protein